MGQGRNLYLRDLIQSSKFHISGNISSSGTASLWGPEIQTYNGRHKRSNFHSERHAKASAMTEMCCKLKDVLHKVKTNTQTANSANTDTMQSQIKQLDICPERERPDQKVFVFDTYSFLHLAFIFICYGRTTDLCSPHRSGGLPLWWLVGQHFFLLHLFFLL